MADALDSESSARKGVEVQVLSRANLEKEVALNYENTKSQSLSNSPIWRDG